MWLETKLVHPSFDKDGDSIWFIDHATLNKEVQFEVARKVFYQFLLKWEKSKYPKLQKYMMWLTFNIKIRVFFFHFVVLKIWLIFSNKLIKLFTRKNKNSPPQNPFFLFKNQPNIDENVNNHCPWHPNLG